MCGSASTSPHRERKAFVYFVEDCCIYLAHDNVVDSILVSAVVSVVTDDGMDGGRWTVRTWLVSECPRSR